MSCAPARFALWLLLSAAIGGSAVPSAAAAREAARPAASAVTGCADFLAVAKKKPAHLRFVGCRLLAEKQGKPLRATYRVEGRFAGSVEAYLIKAAGLKPLKRSCCQWDSPGGQFRASNDLEFFITMVSDETAIAKRSGWAKIPSFEIRVERLTDEI